MKTSTSAKKILSFILWITIVAIAFWAPSWFNYAWWSFGVGFFPIAAKLAYDHFDSVNLLANKFILFISNKAVSWEMKANFEGPCTEKDIVSIIEKWKKNHSVKILQSERFITTVSLEELGMVIKFSIANIRRDEDEHFRELILHVQRMQVPFRTSTNTLNTLIHLINKAKEVFFFEKEKYTFKVVFADKNPYLGLFLKRLQLSNESMVLVDFGESEGAASAKVTVNKNKVSLIAKDLHSLQIFSKKYITLSSLNLSDA